MSSGIVASTLSCDPVSLAAPVLTDNSKAVLANRYLAKENGAIVESPEDMFKRVAETVAWAENEGQRALWSDRFYEDMAALKFLPNSPTLMNAGRSMNMLSACFVLPIPDSVDGIFSCMKDTALIQKAGGGTGFSFDSLRPSGAYIHSSGGTTSGPISFLRAFSGATSAIQQGAFRRGANMAMMSITAPDCLKFVLMKSDLSQLTNYNISVKISDSWMESLGSGKAYRVYDFHSDKWYVVPRALLAKLKLAVEKGRKNPLKITEVDSCYSILDMTAVLPNESTPAGDWLTVDEVWRVLVSGAHKTGEPGVCFIDRVRETEPTPNIGLIQASNPCGEALLLPNEACNLASVNLDRFVSVPFKQAFATEEDIDFDGLAETTKLAVRFLDNVISVNSFPTPAIDKMCKGNRKIGLGVMGLADALFKLGVPYDSKEGLACASRFMACVEAAAMEAEKSLANSRGVFPNWEGSQWDRDHRNVRVRNAEVTSIAPTGTISIIAGCSCGIEPLFSLAFTRNVMNGTHMVEVHPFFKRLAELKGFYSEDLVKDAMEKGSIQHRTDIPDDIKRVFVCAHDISPEWHIRMQARVQRYVSNSVSKTVNMAHDATVDDVDVAFRMAYDLKCKATTVFRDGCRSEQPMQLVKTEEPVDTEQSIAPVDLPDVLPSVRIRQKTAFGHIHLNISVDPKTHKELEIFAHIGHAGGMEQADLEAICRLASLLLRGGYPLHKIIGQLYGIQTSLPKADPSQITSLPRAIASALMTYMEKHGEVAEEPVHDASGKSGGNGDASVFLNRLRNTSADGYNLKCPHGEDNCSGVLIRQGRCTVCTTCGVSSCG